VHEHYLTYLRDLDPEKNEGSHELIDATNLKDFITMNDLHFVRGAKTLYWYFDHESKTWTPVSKTGIEQLPLVAESREKGERTLVDFYSMMRRLGREVDGVYRGLHVRPGWLNLFVRGAWLAPIVNPEFKPDPIFDILLTSLAGGRKEQKALIEQCLLHKLFFPEEVAIPTLVMYGQGGVGKGVFYNICNLIFSRNTVSTTHSRIFTDCNSIIEGKVVIYLDDFMANQTETDNIKHIVYNKEFVTRAQYNAAVINQNMTWWFISNNDPNRPPVVLTGDISEGADRRWLVTKHKDGENLHYRMRQSPDFQYHHAQARYATSAEYFADKLPVLYDPIAISHWLGSLVQKHGEPVAGRPPQAIYGNDYWLAVGESNSCRCEPHERLAEAIFCSNCYDQMEVDALFKFYQSTIGGTKYRTSSSFGKFLTQYVNSRGGLRDTWAKADDDRAYWYRKQRDGLERQNVMIEFNTIKGNLAEAIDDYFRATTPCTEETPVDWAEELAETAHPTYAESDIERRRWFDAVREEQQAKHQLALANLKRRDTGFNQDDFLKVALLLDADEFGKFLGHLSQFYQYKMRQHAVDQTTLLECQRRFHAALKDHRDDYREQYEDIWDVDVCIRWLDQRDVSDIDAFLGIIITNLLKFNKVEVNSAHP